MLCDIPVSAAVISFPACVISQLRCPHGRGACGSPVWCRVRVVSDQRSGRSHVTFGLCLVRLGIINSWCMISQISWLRCLSPCAISQLRCPHGLYDITQSAISCGFLRHTVRHHPPPPHLRCTATAAMGAGSSGYSVFVWLPTSYEISSGFE